MNKKYNLFSLIILVLFSAIVVFLGIRSKRLALSQNFNGVVQKVSYYGGKRDAKVKLNDGQSYLLDLYVVKEDGNVKVGDFLFKRKGELDLYHFKKNSEGHYQLHKMHSYSSFFD